MANYNTRRIIARIETERYSFLAGFLGLFSIIFIRNLFESAFEGTQTFGFSAITSRSFYMIFSHFPLFYISIFLWFLLILCIFTKEEPIKVSKVLLVGMWIIVIPPFIDIIVSRGSGYKLTYLQGIEEFIKAHRFFDFTKDLVQASWGQRIEILLTLLGSFCYVFLKTKHLLKSLICAIIFFLIIFLHGALPNTIAQLPSYLGFRRFSPSAIITGGILAIDSQNYALIFLFSCFIAGLFLLKRYKRPFFHKILELKGSIFILIFSSIGFIYALLLIRPYWPFIFYNPITYLIFFLVVFVCHIINLTPHMPKSKADFGITIILGIISSVSIGLTFIIIIIIFFVLRNLTKLRLIGFIIVFLAGFSSIFQDKIFYICAPVYSQGIEIYGRRLAAWNYFLNRDYQDALREYALVYSYDKDLTLQNRMAQSYLYLGQIDKAIESLEKIKEPGYETALILGDAYIAKREFDKAISVYQSAVLRNLEPADFLIKIARIKAQQGNQPGMDSVLEKSLRFGAPRSKFYQIKGDLYLSHADYPNALKMYERALFYNARSVPGYAGKGMVYYYLRDFKNAEKEFLKALTLDLNNDALYNNLGALYLVTGDYHKARKQFMKSLEINRSQTEAYYNLGLIAEKYGEIAEARSMFSKALEIDSQFIPATKALERLAVQ